MTVALVHLITASADDLRKAWPVQFHPMDFGIPAEPGTPQQAYGPSLPEGVRGITLAFGEPASIGVTLFDSYAEARTNEERLRGFWAGLGGTESGGLDVAEGIVSGMWRPVDDPASQPARMIWVAPAEEPEDTDPEPQPR